MRTKNLLSMENRRWSWISFKSRPTRGVWARRTGGWGGECDEVQVPRSLVNSGTLSRIFVGRGRGGTSEGWFWSCSIVTSRSRGCGTRKLCFRRFFVRGFKFEGYIWMWRVFLCESLSPSISKPNGILWAHFGQKQPNSSHSLITNDTMLRLEHRQHIPHLLFSVGNISSPDVPSVTTRVTSSGICYMKYRRLNNWTVWIFYVTFWGNNFQISI